MKWYRWTAWAMMLLEEPVSRLSNEAEFERMHRRMIEHLRREYRISDEAVLTAMSKVRRHVFSPEMDRAGCNPYGDYPCPIGYGQTMSQPFIVAHMTTCLFLKKGNRVLEIGTGSGYQAAILAELGMDVFSVELIPALAGHAGKILAEEGYPDVHLLTGDGYQGWAEHAPYDAIIVTCGPDDIPGKLLEQLKEGGRMILPVGADVQQLVILRKKDGNILRENDIMVRFVPMVPVKVVK